MAFDFTALQSQQFLIPFLFIFAIIFGSLKVANVFKSRDSHGNVTSENTAVNFIIALALAFFAASNTSFVQLIWSQFGNIAAFFIIMFFIIFVLEAFGIRHKRGEPGKEGSDALIINGAILFILLSISSLFINSLPAIPGIGSGQNLLLLIFIVFILVIFWSAYRAGPERGK